MPDAQEYFLYRYFFLPVRKIADAWNVIHVTNSLNLVQNYIH